MFFVYNYNHSIFIELEEQESCPDLEILSPNIYICIHLAGYHFLYAASCIIIDFV